MKKFLFIAIAFLVMLSGCQPVKAQTPIAPTKAANSSVDTSYLTFKMLPFFDQMSVQAVVTKTSGTVAGYIIPQFSLDGVTYINGTDSLLATNVAVQSKIWTYRYNDYLWYRFRYITSTGVSALTGKYVTRTRP